MSRREFFHLSSYVEHFWRFPLETTHHIFNPPARMALSYAVDPHWLHTQATIYRDLAN